MELVPGPPDLPGAEAGLRVVQPAGEQLRRQARLRQAEDAQHPAVGPVHRSGIRSPGLPRRVRHPADRRGGHEVPRQQGRRQAGQADRRAARTARVRRLLDAEVVRRVPQHAARRSRSRGRTSSSNGCAATSTRNTPFDEVVREVHHRRRQHVRQPAGQLLPHRPRPAEPGRDDGPAVLRHPHAVRQVPQPPVRALDAGRLLQHGRVLRPREAAARTRSSRRRQGKKDGAEVIYVDRDGEVTQPRTGKAMPPKFMGGAVPDDRRRTRTAARCWPTG